MYASDAVTGARKWRFKTRAPLMSGVTPTDGGLVFFGDMAGRIYGFDAESGKSLWTHDLDGAIGGGVISYEINGKQFVAVAFRDDLADLADRRCDHEDRGVRIGVESNRNAGGGPADLRRCRQVTTGNAMNRQHERSLTEVAARTISGRGEFDDVLPAVLGTDRVA